MAVKLSILIPTVSQRESLLSRLLWTIEQQLTDEVEVLVYTGDNIAMGDKLTSMFHMATGDYVVCVDDDDLLADNYVESVLPHLTEDYLGYKILMLTNGKYSGVVRSTWDGDPTWATQPQGIGPKWCVRRAIAVNHVFDNNYTADRAWSRAVAGEIKSGSYVDKCLYIYDFYSNGTLGTEPGHQNRDTQRDVGLYPYTKSRFIVIE